MSAPTTYEIQKLDEAKKRGYSFFLVKGEGPIPAFVYSVGMAQKNLPDVLMFLDSEYVKPQLGMLTNLLDHLIEGESRFGADSISSHIDGTSKVVSMPEIEYTFNVLSPEDTATAIHNYMCRCHFFREVLGEAKAMVVSSDYNLPWSEIKQATAVN